MVPYTLGLDLGPASVGWALIDEPNRRIIACGVRIFPEGVQRNPRGMEISKNAKRRQARNVRRRLARKSQRKHRLRTLLCEAGLWPRDPEAWLRWYALDPHEWRCRALDEALEPYALGRILLHLNQRRGFLAERSREDSTSAVSARAPRLSSELAERIELAGCRTLGEFLVGQSRRQDRIRGQHTRREMYEREFEAIWTTQRRFLGQCLTESLKARIHGIMFFQRPVYWSVGGCCRSGRLRAGRLAREAGSCRERVHLPAWNSTTMGMCCFDPGEPCDSNEPCRWRTDGVPVGLLADGGLPCNRGSSSVAELGLAARGLGVTHQRKCQQLDKTSGKELQTQMGRDGIEGEGAGENQTGRSLPMPPAIANPIVRRALHEVRKVVNAILREYGRPARIHIEMARQMKRSAKERNEQVRRMEESRQRRERAARTISQAGFHPNANGMERYLLWEDQEKVCIYSGRPIRLDQLFEGEIDVDHILPYGRSLDDSYANKVVCYREENVAKGDRTPAEWLQADPARLEEVRQRATRLFASKQQRFYEEGVSLEGFISRHLSDTAFITRSAMGYLRALGCDVLGTRGYLTARLRREWRLNRLLASEGFPLKNRHDHRHHAVDAIVIALTNRRRLQELANSSRAGGMPLPWSGFGQDVAVAVEDIIVSHRAQRRVSGALHEETFYGPTHKRSPAGEDRPWAKRWIEDPQVFVRRKAVRELNHTRQLGKVRDPAIRAILANRLKSCGIDPDEPGPIPVSVWQEEVYMPSGVPIRKVRMLERSRTFRQLRPGMWVKPGSNHHIAYTGKDDDPDAPWQGRVVTAWEAMERIRRHRPVIDRQVKPGRSFLFSLSIGEAFWMRSPEGERICVVCKIDQLSRRVHYRLHADGRPAQQRAGDHLYLSPRQMQSAGACKITIDPLGHIRQACD